MNSQDRQALEDWSLQPVTLLSDEEQLLYMEAAQDFYSNVLESEVDAKTLKYLSRIPNSVDPSLYQTLIRDFLGWALFSPQQTINNDKIAYLGDTRSITLGRMPVFLLKVLHHPSHRQDKVVEDLSRLVQKLKVKHGFIFFRKPLLQKAKDRFFTYIGRILIDGNWHDYFIKKGDTPDRLVKLVQHKRQMSHDINRCDAELETALAFSKLKTDIEVPPGIENRILASNEFWYSFEKGSGLYL